MSWPLCIGGDPATVLRADPAAFDGPGFLEATVLPGRGMMLLQARLRLPDGRVVDALAAPDLTEAAQRLAGGRDDFAGNASFAFGGAILAPFANRIRGRPSALTRTIETQVAGRDIRLPRNWGGRAAGAEQYAMHGLILDRAFAVVAAEAERLDGRLEAGDFHGCWPGELSLDVVWSLEGGALRLQVTAHNTGDIPTPVGIGWHPYFALPSGDRAQARLAIPARARAVVNNYDEVLPTGELEPIAGTAYDFTQCDGRALGDLYLDDCFTGFDRTGADTVAVLRDPAAGVGLRLTALSPPVTALQVYAPPEQSYVALEPQFNLADPFGPEWQDRDTGMVLLQPGGATRYDVTATPFGL